MNIHKLRTVLLSALVAICSIGAVQAQQAVSVNGASCPGATVTFGANSIAINTSNCVGATVTIPTINASTPPAGNTGVAYSTTFTASGSTPITWSATSGAVAGLTLNSSSGVLSGTPTTAGTFPLSITASNAGGSSAALAVSVTISPPSGPPIITSSAPPPATLNASYTHTFTATGAVPITWDTVPTGAAPAGLTLNGTTGVLSGTSTGSNTTFTVRATNASGTTDQVVNFTVAVPVPPAITSATPPAGSTSSAYSFAFTANGTAPIAWTLAAGGTLPPGVTLSSAGTLTGTPTTAGTYSFAVQAANTAGNALAPATGTYSVVIASAGLASLEGTVIPTPSKQPNASGATHAGLNGGGQLMNGWAVDPARCNSPSTSPATTPAITRSWHHNIEFDTYSSSYSNDFFDMAPNEELSYRFVPNQAGIGTITLGETTWGPLPATFITLSTKACDFDYTKLNNGASRDFCYKSATRDNGIYFEVTGGAPSSSTYCKLVPGQTYYFNVRFQDGRIPAGGGAATDSCAAIGSPRCAGLFQIGR